jgi:hypothetical protein
MVVEVTLHLKPAHRVEKCRHEIVAMVTSELKAGASQYPDGHRDCAGGIFVSLCAFLSCKSWQKGSLLPYLTAFHLTHFSASYFVLSHGPKIYPVARVVDAFCSITANGQAPRRICPVRSNRILIKSPPSLRRQHLGEANYCFRKRRPKRVSRLSRAQYHRLRGRKMPRDHTLATTWRRPCVFHFV